MVERDRGGHGPGHPESAPLAAGAASRNLDQPKPGRFEPAAPATKVTRLELFYDLVFVYAFLNVTTMTSARLSAATILISLLALALLWFVWTNFAALGNAVRLDQGVMPLFGFAIMASIFMAAVSFPEAFTETPPGPPGDLIFASCYLLIRTLQVLAFWYSVRSHPQLRLRSWHMIVPPLLTTAFLLLAAAVPQRLLGDTAQLAVRIGLWLLAVVVAYAVGTLIRIEEAAIISAGHWTERHAQIVLVALGESIISLGLGPGPQVRLPLTWPVLIASALGIAVIAALWWVYFDSVAVAAEQVMHRTSGAARVRLARDAYTYLHLPIIAGVILFSLGLKNTVSDIADPAIPNSRDTLARIDVGVLYGGVIIYALAICGIQRRTVRRVDRLQVITLVLLMALIPVADRLPAFAALAMLVVVTVSAVAIQSLRVGQPRQALRRTMLNEQRELELRETEWRSRQQRQGPPWSGR